MERYETAKPSKDLRGLYESPVRKSTLLCLFFRYLFFDCVRYLRRFLGVFQRKRKEKTKTTTLDSRVRGNDRQGVGDVRPGVFQNDRSGLVLEEAGEGRKGLRGFGPARRGEAMWGVAPTRRGSFDYAQDRLFCFGKRTQNHGRPGVALWVPLPQSRRFGLRNSLRSDSPRLHIGFGTAAQPRPQAPSTWRHGMAGLRRQKAKTLGRMRCGRLQLRRGRCNSGNCHFSLCS